VDGFGGDAASVPPSLTGPAGHRGGLPDGAVLCRGKVEEVVFDCFGDFTRFVLDERCSGRRTFTCRERGVGEVLLQACRDRLAVAIVVDERQGDRICEIRLSA